MVATIPAWRQEGVNDQSRVWVTPPSALQRAKGALQGSHRVTLAGGGRATGGRPAHRHTPNPGGSPPRHLRVKANCSFK
eukprot:scaffold3876_cov344-Prasinococcus_capsulatus_cf.AAC.4